MHKVFYLLIAIILSISSAAQLTDSSKALIKQEFLQKSKRQKTTAWILLGTGLALDFAGSLWVVNDPFANGPAVLVAVGTTSILASIPFFIISAKNKKKAMKVEAFFKMEKAPLLTDTYSNPAFPSFHIQINL